MAVPYLDQGYYSRSYSGEYPAYLSGVERMDSANDYVPRYTSAYKVNSGIVRPGHYHHEKVVAGPRKHHGSHEAHHKVRFAGCECKDMVEEKRVEESVDEEADDYIKARHKGFELHKWQTFDM